MRLTKNIPILEAVDALNFRIEYTSVFRKISVHKDYVVGVQIGTKRDYLMSGTLLSMCISKVSEGRNARVNFARVCMQEKEDSLLAVFKDETIRNIDKNSTISDVFNLLLKHI